MNTIKKVTEVQVGDEAFLSGRKFSPVEKVEQKDDLYTVVLENGTRLGPMTAAYYVEVKKEVS